MQDGQSSTIRPNKDGPSSDLVLPQTQTHRHVQSLKPGQLGACSVYTRYLSPFAYAFAAPAVPVQNVGSWNRRPHIVSVV